MARPPRLKVFRARIGFFETVVAASSRPKALQAWGTHQDLFAQGEAEDLDPGDPEAKAALDHPGEVLTRPIGSKGEFKPGAEGAPDVPAPKGGKARPKPPDRSRLDKAEAARKSLDTEEAEAVAGLDAEKKALAERMKALRFDYAERRKAAEAEVREARSAYQAAGGHGSASKSARSTT